MITVIAAATALGSSVAAGASLAPFAVAEVPSAVDDGAEAGTAAAGTAVASRPAFGAFGSSGSASTRRITACSTARISSTSNGSDTKELMCTTRHVS